MKKSKLLTLTALMLAALMLLASCGSEVNGIDSVFAEDAQKEAAPTYSSINAVDALAGAVPVGNATAGLVYFKKTDAFDLSVSTQHIVYNVTDNKVICTKEQKVTDAVTVSLDSVTVNGKEIAFFTITQDNIEDDMPAITTLYDVNGLAIVETTKSVTVKAVLDLIYVDGKCYRVSEAGTIAYAFDYSSLAKFPKIDTKYNNFYYDFESDNCLNVYNDRLEFVSRYFYPAGCDDIGEAILLENGNILLQAAFKEDPMAEEYTVLDGSDKLTLKTYIIDMNDGTAKEIECDYILEDSLNFNAAPEYAKEMGASAEFVIAEARYIESQYQGEGSTPRGDILVAIDNSGNVSEFEPINGGDIRFTHLFANGVWIVSTTDNRSYLMNADGDIIGECTNATNSFGNYLVTSSKIYDAALTVAYDLETAGLRVYETMNNAVLLENKDSELFLYTGSGSPTKLIEKDSNKELIKHTDNYLIIKTETEEATTYALYNTAGTLLHTFDNVMMAAQGTVATTDNATLIGVPGLTGAISYYRIAA